VEEMTEGPSDDPVVRGEEWYQQFGCIACHSTDGSDQIGPSWKGLYGKQETMADGSTIVVDEAYIIESIIDPQASIVMGFENILMPPTGIGMSEEQISDVIAFIESLRE
jgi:cytochrome c oxidase subunit 2